MKAAVVRAFDRPPAYDDFEEATPQRGETVVSVSAAAVSPLVASRASGTHYSADAAPPFVAGVDGVGRTPDGQRVYFAFPKPPFGSMAERVAIAPDLIVSLPDDLDDATAAAAGISGMSCWVPLTRLARIPPGESVLINGATGVSGRLAVQVAKYLGARKVVATGRDEAKLRALADLGADVLLPLVQPAEALRAAARREARDTSIGVVLDYLWGPSAETILDALGGPSAPRGTTRIRFVQIGSRTGPTVSLSGAMLRSSGVEIVGSGIGSSTNTELVSGIGEFLNVFTRARFAVATDVHSLSDVARYWSGAGSEKRLVLTLP